MKILISWSGKQSQAVAKSLYEWISSAVPGSKPWMSTLDVSPGGRWFEELMKQLETTDFCIICLTPDNMRSPWLYFEAGAIAAKHQQAKVCGFLTGMKPSEITPGPFTQFQCVESNSDGTWLLVQQINKSLDNGAHNEELLHTSFAANWPRLREHLKEALLLYDPCAVDSGLETESSESIYKLSDESKQLLTEAVSDKNGTILMLRTMHGFTVQTNGRQLCEKQDARTKAKWQAAIRDLLQQGLIEGRGHKGEVFNVTAEGYRTVDGLEDIPSDTN